MEYHPCGHRGLRLPQLSFGLWHGFCNQTDPDHSRALLRTAVERGITHLDTANVYGPPNGSAETRLGEILKQDFAGRRHELLIATKAGYRVWDGPYGAGASRKHLLASAEESLRRLQLDHVDVFYLHCPDPHTPAQETAGALADLVRSGKARYVGISNLDGDQTAEMADALREAGVPLLIHQVENSMLVPFKAADVLPRLQACGAGGIVFAPLAGGRLTQKYLDGIPESSRAARAHYLKPDAITQDLVTLVRRLVQIAADHGRTLPQLALRWALQHGSVCSALIGASRPEHITAHCDALDQPPLTPAERDAVAAPLQAYHGRPLTADLPT